MGRSNDDQTFLIMLGNRLRELRLERHLSQEKVSLYGEINKNYVCDIEKGRRNPTILILNKLARYYDVPMNELFNFDKK